jgi:hypothetical protein
MGRTCLVLLRRLCSYFSALLQQYFSVNEQCFPLTTNQYQRQQPNFSEPNRASIFCIEQIFISSATGSRMPALRSFPVVTDQRSYLSMKMNSQRVQLITSSRVGTSAPVCFLSMPWSHHAYSLFQLLRCISFLGPLDGWPLTCITETVKLKTSILCWHLIQLCSLAANLN